VEPGAKKNKKTKIGKVRVKLQTIGIAAVTPNHYTISRTALSWQSDLFLCIASCHETESLTAGTITPADLLPPEYRLEK